jgi:hypothetical protein
MVIELLMQEDANAAGGIMALATLLCYREQLNVVPRCGG